MARIGFIGLGNMGLPMAQNLIKAGHQVEGVDVTTMATDKLKAAGGAVAETAKVAASRADVVITMLPAGKQVREVYLGPGGIIDNGNAGTLLIDCSTIDVETARAVAAAAEKKGLLMLDAPVSGGIAGAAAGTLTFMVGGSARAFERALSILQHMGKTIVHAGGAGNGQRLHEGIVQEARSFTSADTRRSSGWLRWPSRKDVHGQHIRACPRPGHSRSRWRRYPPSADQKPRDNNNSHI